MFEDYSDIYKVQDTPKIFMDSWVYTPSIVYIVQGLEWKPLGNVM